MNFTSFRGAFALAFAIACSPVIGADAPSPVFKQVTVNAATGTPPFVISSTSKVVNLYADRAALADTVTTNANLSGDVTSTGNATTIANNAVTNAKAAQMAANTVKANATSALANAADFAMPSCDTATKALQWTTSTGFACNSSITATTFLGLTGGTSGGVPYFSAANTLASSAALTANAPVIGGGAGVAPSVGTRSGNTTAFVTTTGTQTSGDCVKIDANGNHVANGSACAAPGGAWTAYTPTLSCTSGTLTTASASGRWQQIGKILFVSFSITITTNGTCATAVRFTLPNSLVLTSSTSGSGRANAVGGLALQIQCLATASLCSILTYDNLYPGSSGQTLIGSIVVEVD